MPFCPREPESGSGSQTFRSDLTRRQEHVGMVKALVIVRTRQMNAHVNRALIPIGQLLSESACELGTLRGTEF